MKKSISIILVLVLLISNIFMMTSCDLPSENGKGTPISSSVSKETPAPAEGRKYGDYQVITLTDEATVELIENMWMHKSWRYIAASSTQQMKANFYRYVLGEEHEDQKNTYLLEILEREDAIDLLLWRFDKFAHTSKEELDPREPGRAFMYCLISDVIQARMTDSQKQAIYLILADISYDVTQSPQSA